MSNVTSEIMGHFFKDIEGVGGLEISATGRDEYIAKRGESLRFCVDQLGMMARELERQYFASL